MPKTSTHLSSTAETKAWQLPTSETSGVSHKLCLKELLQLLSRKKSHLLCLHTQSEIINPFPAIAAKDATQYLCLE